DPRTNSIGRGEVDAHGSGRHDDRHLVCILLEPKLPVADRPDVRVRLEGLSHCCELALGPPIVAIEESDEFSLGCGKTSVEGGSLAAVGLAEMLHDRREFLNDGSRVVRGTVIDNEDFELGGAQALFEDAHDSLFDVAFMVISVYQRSD